MFRIPDIVKTSNISGSYMSQLITELAGLQGLVVLYHVLLISQFINRGLFPMLLIAS